MSKIGITFLILALFACLIGAWFVLHIIFTVLRHGEPFTYTQGTNIVAGIKFNFTK